METIGGYRLLRSLGSGPRAEVWLGHSGRGLAAIKLYRQHVPTESIGAEIESLGRASSRHLQRLEDLASAPDGRPCLILGRLSAQNLGGLVEQGMIEAGEAVTMLAPIALAVAELHRVGVAHGGVRAGSILFDDLGAPVLACFGAARPVAEFPEPPEARSMSEAGLMAEPAVAQDVRSLAELGSLVLSRVPGAEEEVEWITAADATAEAGSWPGRFAERLFRLADARPLRLGVLPEGRPERNKGFAIVDAARAGADGESDDDVQSENPPRGRRRWWEALPIPSDLAETITGWAESFRSAGFSMRLRESLRPVRKSVWVLAAVVTACVVAGIALIPPDADSVAPSVSVEPEGSVPSPGASRSAGSDPRIRGVDPVVAAEALLERRAECFRLRSVLCLDGVDQLGSAAMDADNHAIRLVQRGGVRAEEPDYTDSVIDLVERLGDAALLELSLAPVESESAAEPGASLLLVQEEVGWRIRDLVPPSTSNGRLIDSED